jgi:hypothetical protein
MFFTGSFEPLRRLAYAAPVGRLSLIAVLVLSAGAARADNLLRGPVPFTYENELSFHGAWGAPFGDTFGGPKATVDYGYKIDGGLWLDLGFGFLSGRCRPHAENDVCARKGDAAEVLGGIKWKLRMNVPVVPYAKAVAGFAYLFPDGSRSALGPIVRGGLGAKYFLYEWLGLGLELTASLGHAGYQDGAGLDRTLGGVDVALGAELQF